MSRADNIVRASAPIHSESPYAPGQEFGAEADEVVRFADGVTVPLSTWIGARLKVEHDPRWYGIGEARFVAEARAVGFINGEGRPAVPTGIQGFAPEPVEEVTDEDIESVEEFIAAATDRRYALLLRMGR